MNEESDLLDFIAMNIDDIKEYLNYSSSHLAKSEILFKDYPILYDELLEEYRKHKLIEYLYNYFPDNFERIYLLIDENFVNITKYC